MLAGALEAPGLLARIDVASTTGLRARAAADVQAATLRPRPVEAWALTAGPGGGAALGLEARQTDSFVDGLALDGAFPALRAWTAPIVLAPDVFADAHVVGERRLATDLLRASLTPRLSAGTALGPVRVAVSALARATGARGPNLGDATAVRLAGGAAAAVSLRLARAGPPGETVHEIEPRIAVAWAGLAVDDGPPSGFLQDPEVVIPGPRVEASVASRWFTSTGETPVAIEAGVLAGDDAAVAFAEGTLSSGRARADGAVSVDAATGVASSFLDAGVGAGPLALGLGQAHLARGVPLPADGRPRPGELPAHRLVPPPSPRDVIDLGILRADLSLLSALQIGGRAFTDLGRKKLVAAEATVLLHARCRCLTVGLGAAIWEGRRLPEVHAIVHVP
jgi:hypothetical protein